PAAGRIAAMRIAPSILAADLADLAGALAVCEAGGADLVHVDVMDGRFVPNLTFGIPVLAALRRRTRLPLDVHLMVEDPGRLLDDYLAAGADRVAVHWEAAAHLDRLLSRVREGGAAAGVALNPTTPVEVLADALPALDFVLLMSVNPGFAGQRFLPYVVDKAERLGRLIAERGGGRPIEIGVDGGVGADNIARLAAAGVGMSVAGSAVFSADDPAAAISRLRASATSETPSEIR
ncbi:MAG TPA: ribulose-phosphate 3-epimerase, partial [Thermoanaerobaculia bacterium]|nr:ribulose-phosphate 3-epimerase [Thermoanaerobaculia bacterium]